jgi:hypothetical protein
MTTAADISAALEGVPAHARPILLRFLSQLSQTSDPTLLVLRSHLLLEEIIHAAIASAMRDPAHLPRLQFAQSVAILKALSGVHPADRTWHFLSRLGALRNHLSHSLETSALERDIDALIKIVAPQTAASIAAGEERAYLFTLAVAFIGGRLASLVPAAPHPRAT